MTTDTAQLADSQHPWIGLASFTEGDREFFAGRGEEIDELLRLVRRDILTLLYGVSGLGKTSLLQAGLFPALRAEDCLPVPIRLDYREDAAPLTAQVLGAIIAAADAARVEAPQPRLDERLWEYLHRGDNHFGVRTTTSSLPSSPSTSLRNSSPLAARRPSASRGPQRSSANSPIWWKTAPRQRCATIPWAQRNSASSPRRSRSSWSCGKINSRNSTAFAPTSAPWARTASAFCRWASGRLARSSPWVRRCLHPAWRIASSSLSLVATTTPTPRRSPLPPRC